MDDSLVSFVVIAYNEEHQIRECLAAIVGQQDLGPHEVIVVNDGSTDETALRVEEFARDHPSVRLVTQPNGGRGAARARGVDAVRGDLVAFVDGDISLPVDWLERCRSELREQGCDAVGGIAIPDGDAAFVCDFFRLTPRVAAHTITITGNNGLFTRELIDQVKFDRSLRTAEDVAFNHALVAAGFTARSVKSITVWHRENKGYVGSLAWLFESGISATDQLRHFKKLRTPDLAFFGALGAIGVSVAAIPLVGVRPGGALTAAYLLAVGSAHLRGKAVIEPRPAYVARYALASVTNSTLTASYLLGRAVGLFTKGPFAKREEPRLGLRAADEQT